MTPELQALARRAVACEGWRWMPGMRAMVTPEGYGPVPASPDRMYKALIEAHQAVGTVGQWPDLSDPATLGCLLALVRAAWGDVQIIMTYSPCNGWWDLSVGEDPDRVEFVGLSLAETLVAALESAP